MKTGQRVVCLVDSRLYLDVDVVIALLARVFV